MLPALVVFAAVAAAPVKIAAPALLGNGVTDAELEGYGVRLDHTLTRRGAVVLAPRDIEATLGAARPTCPVNEHPCMTQLGHALNADGVLTGTVRSTGFDLQIDLELLTRKGGVTPWSGRAGSSSEALAAFETAADVFGDALGLKRARTIRSSKWWLPGVVGVGLLVVSGIFGLLDKGDVNQLEGQNGMPSSLTLAQANTVYSQGRAFETIALSGLALGCVGLLISTLWFFVTASPPP